MPFKLLYTNTNTVYSGLKRGLFTSLLKAEWMAQPNLSDSALTSAMIFIDHLSSAYSSPFLGSYVEPTCHACLM